MGWSLSKQNGSYVWRCDFYTDLKMREINNMAEYGQPFNPYQSGFDHAFYDKNLADFSNLIIEMPQTQVMLHGYGRRVVPEDFAVVEKFLAGKFKLKDGSYSFQNLLTAGLVEAKDRFMKASLYGFGESGEIDSAGAQYIHGSVGFALMANTVFVVSPKKLTVNAEIGALNDNWDFESGNRFANLLNPIVEAVVGPDNNRIKKPIKINFFGLGVVRVKSKSLD